NHSTNITTDLSPNIINPPTDSFQNSQNDIHKVNNNFFFHINFLTKIENEFNKVIESFANTRVEDIPLIPKQSISKKFLGVVEIINKYILPKHLHENLSYHQLNAIIFCSSVTAVR